jgi:deoxyribodipyrimidine photo-lyase
MALYAGLAPRDADGVDPARVHELRRGAPGAGPVVYWMSREQRVRDNWGLLHAGALARAARAPLVVAFALAPRFLEAPPRAWAFMLAGLRETEARLRGLGIGFHLLLGDPGGKIANFVLSIGAGALVTDFDPLRIKREWQAKVAAAVDIPFHEVDSRNVVPARFVSDRQEWAAHTLRRKLVPLLGRFLVRPPRVGSRRYAGQEAPPADWGAAARGLASPLPAHPAAGEQAAAAALRRFVAGGLQRYHRERNDPNAGATSGLSPYLHFGQVSAQRVAVAVLAADAPPEAKDAFLEELLTRRELSDNYCLHNVSYDRIEGCPSWALRTLAAHAGDKREWLYDEAALERGQTHDPLWNAAQTEMVRQGRMHGYLRMYWAKKILEWTRSPAEAVRIAVALNDRYQLDGRDPNGYAGILWSIGGLHDRPWFERLVFGQIRFMSASGARSKFDVDLYIAAASSRD